MTERAETGDDGSFAPALTRAVWLPLVMSGVARGVAGVGRADSWLARIEDGRAGWLGFAHLIARPMPESLGPAYRFGVTLALAALASGESEPLDPDRSDALRALGRSLPNRFGDLLLALVDRLEDPALPLPDDLVWFDAVWPGLWAGPGVDDG